MKTTVRELKPNGGLGSETRFPFSSSKIRAHSRDSREFFCIIPVKKSCFALFTRKTTDGRSRGGAAAEGRDDLQPRHLGCYVTFFERSLGNRLRCFSSRRSGPGLTKSAQNSHSIPTEVVVA